MLADVHVTSVKENMIVVDTHPHLKLYRKGTSEINGLCDVGFDKTAYQGLFYFLMGLNRSSSKSSEASEDFREEGSGLHLNIGYTQGQISSEHYVDDNGI